jgi:hypothetical protein
MYLERKFNDRGLKNLKTQKVHNTIRVFVSMVAGAFQITFRAKMHVNDVFLFF